MTDFFSMSAHCCTYPTQECSLTKNNNYEQRTEREAESSSIIEPGYSLNVGICGKAGSGMSL